MIIIINNTVVNFLEWTIFKGLSKQVEDFSRSKMMLFAVSETNKIPLSITSVKNIDENGVNHCIKAEIPKYLEEQIYDIELIWIKNNRSVNRTYQENVFKIDLNYPPVSLIIKTTSTAQVYGYDGLSAYEIAMLKAENPISENDWLRDLLAKKADAEALAAEIEARQHADTILTSSIHTECDLRTAADTALGDRIDAEAQTRSAMDGLFIELLNNISNKMSTDASSSNKLTDKNYVDNLVYSTLDSKADKVNTYTKAEVNAALNAKANQVDLESIESKIPTCASASNQLADKEFVNSSISTNTAAFRGTYNIVTGLELSADATNAEIAQALLVVTSSCDNNDYCFAAIPVSNEMPTTIKEVRRFKYSETNNSWIYEYTLNNSGFTAAQWAAINSNITSNLTAKLSSLPTSETLESVLNSKANINDVYTINQTDSTFIKQSEKINYISEDVVDNSRVPTNLAVRLFSTLLITALASKQDVINDLDIIRSNASGALQRSGGSMTGNLDLNNHALLVRITGGNARYGIRFTGQGVREGVYVGNPNMRLFLEADPNLDLIHKKNNYYHTILDEGNVKTVNGNSIYGSGDIPFPDVSDKQDVISDLSTIRSGAAAGATAYQKPQSGIPASDIASGVIPDISNLANKSGSLSQDFAAKSLGVLGKGTSNGIKLYRSNGQLPYGRIIMESDLVSGGIDYMLPTTGIAEQSAVVLATKASVDAKYTKPQSGIPASDIAAGVIPDVSNFITNSVNNLVNYYLKSETYTKQEVDNSKEDKSNKVTSLSSNSTDTQYPSAKCVYDAIQAELGAINTILDTI